MNELAARNKTHYQFRSKSTNQELVAATKESPYMKAKKNQASFGGNTAFNPDYLPHYAQNMPPEGTADDSPLQPKIDLNLLHYDKNIGFLDNECQSVSQSDIKEFNDTLNDIQNQTQSQEAFPTIASKPQTQQSSQNPQLAYPSNP